MIISVVPGLNKFYSIQEQQKYDDVLMARTVVKGTWLSSQPELSHSNIEIVFPSASLSGRPIGASGLGILLRLLAGCLTRDRAHE